MRSGDDDRTDVLIVGGGPVGLDLACRLLLRGLTVRVLEKRPGPTLHSRSIGIHPPSLEALAEIGIADRLIAAGIPVREGVAIARGRELGRLAFHRCPAPYRFVLAIPQWRTEQILEERLRELSPNALMRDVEVARLAERKSGDPEVRVRTSDGRTFAAAWLAGCDGKHSAVRPAVGIAFPGRSYADTYVMGDFEDNTEIGQKAAIFLTPEGLVESFPLPEGLRRWVIRTPAAVDEPEPFVVTDLVRERTGYRPDPSTARMISAFGVERRLADSMARGRVLLAGDAAHVVSPIGGQGMNLGWLDSAAAVRALEIAVRRPSEAGRVMEGYSRTRRRAAIWTARRAEFNMSFGRPSGWYPIKIAAARAMLTPALSGVIARRFTMRGL